MDTTGEESYLVNGGGSDWSHMLGMAKSVCPNVDWSLGPHGPTAHCVDNSENQGVQSVIQTQKEDGSGYRDRGAIPKQPQTQPQVISASGSTWPDTHYQGAHGQDRMTNELEQWLTQNNASGETKSKLTQGGFINMALFKTLEPEDVDTMDIRPLAQRKVIKKLCQPSLQGSSQSTVMPATTDGPESIMSGLQSLLGRKTTQHAPGERVDLDPLNYLLPKVKAKHLDITDYVQTTGQEVEEVLSGSGDRQIILKSGPKKIQLENVRPMQWVAAHLKTRRHSVERIHSPCHKVPLYP